MPTCKSLKVKSFSKSSNKIKLLQIICTLHMYILNLFLADLRAIKSLRSMDRKCCITVFQFKSLKRNLGSPHWCRGHVCRVLSTRAESRRWQFLSIYQHWPLELLILQSSSSSLCNSACLPGGSTDCHQSSLTVCNKKGRQLFQEKDLHWWRRKILPFCHISSSSF